MRLMTEPTSRATRLSVRRVFRERGYVQCDGCGHNTSRVTIVGDSVYCSWCADKVTVLQRHAVGPFQWLWRYCFGLVEKGADGSSEAGEARPTDRRLITEN